MVRRPSRHRLSPRVAIWLGCSARGCFGTTSTSRMPFLRWTPPRRRVSTKARNLVRSPRRCSRRESRSALASSNGPRWTSCPGRCCRNAAPYSRLDSSPAAPSHVRMSWSRSAASSGTSSRSKARPRSKRCTSVTWPCSTTCTRRQGCPSAVASSCTSMASTSVAARSSPASY